MVDGDSKLAIDAGDFRSACIQLHRERILKLVSTKQLLDYHSWHAHWKYVRGRDWQLAENMWRWMEMNEESCECVRGSDNCLRVWCQMNATLADEDVVRKSVTGSAVDGSFSVEDYNNMLCGKKGINGGSSLAAPSFMNRAVSIADDSGLLSMALEMGDSTGAVDVSAQSQPVVSASSGVPQSQASVLHFYILLLPLRLLIIGLCWFWLC